MPYYAHNDHTINPTPAARRLQEEEPWCVPQGDLHGGSTFCDGEKMTVRSVYVPFWLPWQFEAHELLVTNPYGVQGRVEFNAIENYGWSFPIAVASSDVQDWWYSLEVDDPNSKRW